MDLGATIYKLRTAKNLSQEELAGLLDVSRQSVSKWETNAATPDLEKLIRLCDIFNVSLDELAGRSRPGQKESAAAAVPMKNPALAQRKIVGYILLGLSVVAAFLFLFLRDLFYGTAGFWFLGTVPSMFCCSLACLSDKAHIGYRCFWLVCLWSSGLIFEYLIWFAFRLFGPIRYPVFFLLYHLVILLLGAFAAQQGLGGVEVPYRKKRLNFLLSSWFLFLVLCWFSPKLIYSRTISDALGHNAPVYIQYAACVVLMALLSVLFTASYLHLRSWREQKKTNS